MPDVLSVMTRVNYTLALRSRHGRNKRRSKSCTTWFSWIVALSPAIFGYRSNLVNVYLSQDHKTEQLLFVRNSVIQLNYRRILTTLTNMLENKIRVFVRLWIAFPQTRIFNCEIRHHKICLWNLLDRKGMRESGSRLWQQRDFCVCGIFFNSYKITVLAVEKGWGWGGGGGGGRIGSNFARDGGGGRGNFLLTYFELKGWQTCMKLHQL